MKFFSKPMTLVASLIFVITFLFSACQNSAEKEKEKENSTPASTVTLHADHEKYVIDKKESRITWKGWNSLKPDQAHVGYVFVSRGELMIENDHLAGGVVVLDMNTITDKDHGSDNNLIHHLKDTDFFDVKTFPITSFIITGVEPASGHQINITGNLTIKGITQAVTFPASMEVKDGRVTALGKVTIDRTKWDVRYNSGKFYDNLADKAISDDMEFEMKIVAKEQLISFKFQIFKFQIVNLEFEI